MSCECVRPMTNRSGTLPREQKKEAYHIKSYF